MSDASLAKHGFGADPPLFRGGGGHDDQGAAQPAFVELRWQALSLEDAALDSDRAGDAEQARSRYRQAADRLSAAAAACPERDADKVKLSRRAGQALGRAVYLESLAGARADVPPEEHLPPADRPPRGGGGDAAGGPVEEGRWPLPVKQAFSAAAVGGATGLLVLHGPVIAVVMAAGTAYAATRADGVGQAARSIGDMGIAAADKVHQFAEEQGLVTTCSTITLRLKEELQQGCCFRASPSSEAEQGPSRGIADGIADASAVRVAGGTTSPLVAPCA